MRLAVLLAFCILPLSGCLVDETPPDTESPPASEAGLLDMTLFVAPDGTLSMDEPASARQTMDWGYGQWLDGTPPPAWSGPDGPLRIVSGNLSLWYEATKPSASGDLRPELTAWFGSDASLVHHVFIDGPDAVQPGQIIEATSELRIPEGGLVLSPERHVELRIGSYYADGPQTDVIDLLMGNGTPSRLDLLVAPLEWSPVSGEVVLDETIQVIGGRCTVDANPEGSAESKIAITLDESVRGLSVRLDQAGSEPTRDIDFAVRGPAGEDMGGGHGSFNVEGADVWWPNLEVAGPGEYLIHLYACTAQVGDVHLEATIYR